MMTSPKRKFRVGDLVRVPSRRFGGTVARLIPTGIGNGYLVDARTPGGQFILVEPKLVRHVESTRAMPRSKKAALPKRKANGQFAKKR